MKQKQFMQRVGSLALLSCSILVGQQCFAQTETFDSGSLPPEWKRSNFNPALVNESFPDTGMGKGFRIRANPVPNTAPAVALFYRDEIYTDFYLSMDIVDWPGTDKNQAIVLFARATFGASPAQAQGVILNYDTAQYGELPGNRRQGQFQINMVTNNFATKTLAVAEVTLQPGRPYRLVFKGEGTKYTGMVYDHADLTKPVVTLQADDAAQGGPQFQPFTSGKCGILSFSRQSTVGTTDVTIDNYYAGATDPSAAVGGALAHPVAGTPVVDTRMPAARFQNFHNPASGISFTAKTYTSDVIDAGATKLRLNGVDVSSALTLSANGSSITGSLPGSQLAANTVYNAAIEVQDLSGTKKSTNLFWFDTFSDAYLRTAPVKTIEAEDYNYDSGKYQLDPIPVSGFNTNGEHVNGYFLTQTGYYEFTGTRGVDYWDVRTGTETPWFAEYRNNDGVGLSAGMFPEKEDLNESLAATTHIRRSDNVRSQFASSNLLEYVVHRTEPGEWLNYTRSFAAGNYGVYLRVASFGATTVELQQVTSDPSLPDQTTNTLGTFRIPNLIARYNYVYVPLVDDNGSPVTLALSGTNTLRLAITGTPGEDIRKLAINYILFAPQTLQVLSSATVDGSYVADPSAVIDAGAKRVTVPLGAGSKYFRLGGMAGLRITNTSKSGNNLVFTYE